MAIADLPQAFRGFKMDDYERIACHRFLDKAQEVAPDVEILGPRRTQAGDIKIMLKFPEGDSWDKSMALSMAAAQIRKETSILFILD
jgi:hypothetical protein